MRLEVFIPFLPPSANATHKIGKHGMYKTKEAKYWQERAALVIGSEAGIIDWRDTGKPFGLRLVYYGTRKGSDLDNYITIVQNTIAEKLNFNDSRIDFVQAVRGEGREKGVLIYLDQEGV